MKSLCVAQTFAFSFGWIGKGLEFPLGFGDSCFLFPCWTESDGKSKMLQLSPQQEMRGYFPVKLFKRRFHFVVISYQGNLPNWAKFKPFFTPSRATKQMFGFRHVPVLMGTH